MPLQSRLRIKVNSLLRGGGPTLSLEDAFRLRALAELAKSTLEDAGNTGNFALVSEQLLNQVHSVYGPAGVFQLSVLATAHDHREVEHFLGLVRDSMTMRELVPEGGELAPDNATLPEGKALARFKWNVVQPSLSRKLYRAGRHHGSLVYGVGGPRILVSHPFRGASRKSESYDMYVNALDVVTSLMIRGFAGSFHFLDYLPGLSYEVDGVPAWVLWFSVIANHSDLVVFVDATDGFGESQQREIAFTSDYVQKKIVRLPTDELRWATTEASGAEEIVYVGEGTVMTKEEWYRMEAEHAGPFIEAYPRDGVPDDRWYRMDEDGDISSHPLDFPRYEYI